MGFACQGLWVMGYCGLMGYGLQIPAHQLGGPKMAWDFRGYGLSEAWVKRVSTVQWYVMGLCKPTLSPSSASTVQIWKSHDYWIYSTSRIAPEVCSFNIPCRKTNPLKVVPGGAFLSPSPASGNEDRDEEDDTLHMCQKTNHVDTLPSPTIHTLELPAKHGHQHTYPPTSSP